MGATPAPPRSERSACLRQCGPGRESVLHSCRPTGATKELVSEVSELVITSGVGVDELDDPINLLFRPHCQRIDPFKLLGG